MPKPWVVVKISKNMAMKKGGKGPKHTKTPAESCRPVAAKVALIMSHQTSRHHLPGASACTGNAHDSLPGLGVKPPLGC